MDTEELPVRSEHSWQAAQSFIAPRKERLNMHKPQEIRQALRFLDDLRQVHQSIQARLHAPAAAPAAAPVSCPPPAPPLAFEDENRGYAEAEALLKAGDTAAALERLQDLATRGALRWDIHNDLGTLLLNAGQLEAGLQALKTAASLEFSSTHALRNLIVAYVQQGEIANALAASCLLLRKEPQNPDIPAFLRDLLLEASPRLDDYGWLSPRLAETLTEQERLRAQLEADAPRQQAQALKAELFDWCREVPALPEPATPSPWAPPPAIDHADQASCIVFLPPTCGGVSVYRIMSVLCARHYHYINFEVAAYMANDPYQGELSAKAGYDYALRGSVYSWREAQRLGESLRNSALAPDDFRHLVVLRDPRDSLVSLYHILRDPQYVPPKELTAFQEHNLREKERLAAMSVDEYVIESAPYWAQNITNLADLLADVPPERLEFLSYAVLCEDFPAFLQRLTGFLQIRPNRRVYEDLLATEDVKRQDTLRKTSMARLAKAAPLPGRHKRELRPDTIAELNRITARARQWMAALEVPEYRHLYND